jgi:predicted  nucleic acid-binding Zn-ribbon protein
LQAIEAEQSTASESREQYAMSERRAMVLAGELEELRTQLEAAERARKAAEGELHEASDRVSEMSVASASLATHKRKLENDIQAMQVSDDWHCK